MESGRGRPDTAPSPLTMAGRGGGAAAAGRASPLAKGQKTPRSPQRSGCRRDRDTYEEPTPPHCLPSLYHRDAPEPGGGAMAASGDKSNVRPARPQSAARPPLTLTPTLGTPPPPASTGAPDPREAPTLPPSFLRLLQTRRALRGSPAARPCPQPPLAPPRTHLPAPPLRPHSARARPAAHKSAKQRHVTRPAPPRLAEPAGTCRPPRVGGEGARAHPPHKRTPPQTGPPAPGRAGHAGSCSSPPAGGGGPRAGPGPG